MRDCPDLPKRSNTFETALANLKEALELKVEDEPNVDLPNAVTSVRRSPTAWLSKEPEGSRSALQKRREPARWAPNASC